MQKRLCAPVHFSRINRPQTLFICCPCCNRTAFIASHLQSSNPHQTVSPHRSKTPVTQLRVSTWSFGIISQLLALNRHHEMKRSGLLLHLSTGRTGSDFLSMSLFGALVNPACYPWGLCKRILIKTCRHGGLPSVCGGLFQRLTEDECDNSVLRSWYTPNQTSGSVDTMSVHIGGQEDARHLCSLLQTWADGKIDMTQILAAHMESIKRTLQRSFQNRFRASYHRFFKCMKWRASLQKTQLTHNPGKLLPLPCRALLWKTIPTMPAWLQ